MKNSIFALILSVCISAPAFSKTLYSNADSTVCLEINGKLLNNCINKYYKVELISCNTLLESKVLQNRKEFKFNLKKNTHYAIRISKKGFVSRLISIYTSVPKKCSGIYRFQFDTELVPKAESLKLDKEALDFPIAIVSFNDEMQCFYYNEEYTSNIKRQIYLGKDF